MLIENKNISDELLWNSFLSGKESAYNSIYNRYAKPLIAQGLQFTADKELVKDCIHNVFVRIYKNRMNLKPVTNLKLYLFVALKNNIISAMTKQKIDLELLDEQVRHSHLSDNCTIEDHLIDQETQYTNKMLISKILTQLTSRQREVVHYRFYENMSIDEIAVLMGMNYQSVQNLIQRSLKKISDLLKKYEKE